MLFHKAPKIFSFVLLAATLMLGAPVANADDISGSKPFRVVPDEIRELWGPISSNYPVVFGQLSPKSWFMVQFATRNGQDLYPVKAYLDYNNVSDAMHFTGNFTKATFPDDRTIVFSGVMSRPSVKKKGDFVELPAKITIEAQNANLNFRPGLDVWSKASLQVGKRQFVLHNVQLKKVN